MPRLIMHIEHRSPVEHIPVLKINGTDVPLSERELTELLMECIWARDSIKKSTTTYTSKGELTC